MRILLVEDSPTDAMLTREAIDSARFHITHVERLSQAIEHLDQEPIDVVLLDLGLPDSTGIETFQRLQQHDSTIPIVILSGKDDEALALNAVAAGAEDYLVKSQIQDGALIRAIRYSCERRRIKESLRQSESRLSEAVRLAHLGYWSQDLATGQIKWSDLLYEIFDIDRSQFSHHYTELYNYIHPEDIEHVKQSVDNAILSRGLLDITFRILVQNQSRYIHSVGHVYLGRDGKPSRLAGTSQDITEKVVAEDSRRLRERAIGATTQGIVICDYRAVDFPIVYVSPGFEKLTQYTSDDALGKNCRFLQGVDTDREAVAQLRHHLQIGEPLTVEFLNYRKDGSPFWNELSISPVRDEFGQITHFVGVQTEVTARRRLEEQFRQAQKMEAIGKLAGGVAHDFNNLLTVINGYSELLLETMPEEDPSRALLVEILRAGERSAGLTRQLLAFSRQQVLAPRDLDLNAVVTDSEKFLRRVIGEDVQLVTKLTPGIGLVRADPGQLEQVLMNLVVNARDAMPTGGKLTIATSLAKIDEEFVRGHPGTPTGSYVRLTVSDTGSGMTEEVKARVFEPFFTTKPQGKGTGLGLATVFGIIQQSHGLIDITTKLGSGTTFQIYLPQLGSSGDLSGTQAKNRTVPRGTETVLLVEDEDGVRSLTRHVLISSGYTVLEASDGNHALWIAINYPSPIALIIADVVMPGSGGRKIVDEFCKHHPETKVLYISGYTDDAVMRHGIQSERVNFLQKPFNAFALGNKVREILDTK